MIVEGKFARIIHRPLRLDLIRFYWEMAPEAYTESAAMWLGYYGA